ncbi:MAG TPA: hypothetical protein VHU92_27285 [Streptosporangiaceae bacterium]|nr:hypothetical protein [Streptosporangiaceae bacterium]
MKAQAVTVATTLGLSAALLLAVGQAGTAATTAAAPWRIEATAGGPGGPGPAGSVNIGAPCAVTFAGTQLYVDAGLIRSVSIRTGRLTTPVGSVDLTSGGNGSPAAIAHVAWPCGLTVDHAGNLLIADGGYFDDGSPTGGDNEIRVVPPRSGMFYGQKMTADHIYAIAGNSHQGFSGDGGPATAAELSGPGGIAVDPAGNVLFADAGNDRVRLIAARTGTFYGQKMTAGDIYTIVGTGNYGFSGDGGPATAADLSLTPQGDGKVDLSEPWPMLRVDQAGNIVLGDSNTCHIRAVAGRSGTFYGQKMTADDIYTIAGHGGCGYSGGGPAASARIGVVTGVAVDGAGNVVFSDMGSITPQGKDGTRVQVVAARTGRYYGISMRAGDLYSVAGDGKLGTSGNGGPATKAEFAGPTGVTVDSAGNILVADGQGYGDSQAYYANDRVRAIAARSGRYYGVKMTAGHIYSIVGTDSDYTGNGGLATSAQIAGGNPNDTSFGTTGMTLDRYGNQVITDSDDGKILVVAARTGRFYAIAMRARHIYLVAGGGTGFPGGGRPASKVRLTSPTSVTTDSAGNLLMALYGANRLSVLAVRTGRFYGQDMKAGRVYLIAGNGNFGAGGVGFGGPALKAALTPTYLGIDHHGNVVIADSPDGFVMVVADRTGTFYGRKMTAGHIYRVAGNGIADGPYANGVVATATPVYAAGVTVDAAGNLVLCTDGRVRVVPPRTGSFYGQKMAAGHIYTIAGDGHFGDSGDGGPALQADLSPDSAALDAAGNVVLAAGGATFGGSGYIRVIAVRTGTFYGQSMTAGDIYRVAGGGSSSQGDGGQALQAEFYSPTAVGVARGGDVYFADGVRVWMIEP